MTSRNISFMKMNRKIINGNMQTKYDEYMYTIEHIDEAISKYRNEILKILNINKIVGFIHNGINYVNKLYDDNCKLSFSEIFDGMMNNKIIVTPDKTEINFNPENDKYLDSVYDLWIHDTKEFNIKKYSVEQVHTAFILFILSLTNEQLNNKYILDLMKHIYSTDQNESSKYLLTKLCRELLEDCLEKSKETISIFRTLKSSTNISYGLNNIETDIELDFSFWSNPSQDDQDITLSLKDVHICFYEFFKIMKYDIVLFVIDTHKELLLESHIYRNILYDIINNIEYSKIKLYTLLTTNMHIDKQINELNKSQSSVKSDDVYNSDNNDSDIDSNTDDTINDTDNNTDIKNDKIDYEKIGIEIDGELLSMIITFNINENEISELWKISENTGIHINKIVLLYVTCEKNYEIVSMMLKMIKKYDLQQKDVINIQNISVQINKQITEELFIKYIENDKDYEKTICFYNQK